MSHFDWPVVEKKVETIEAPQNKRFYGKMKCLSFWPTYKGEKGKKNHVHKNQGWEPIHQKYKARQMTT
jgi:hypothetical protein